MNTYLSNEVSKVNHDNVETFKTFMADEAFGSLGQCLTSATIEQMGGVEVFLDSAADIAHYGANTGWSGFIYSHDIAKFYDANKPDIIGFLKSQAQEYGVESMFSLVAGFNCLKNFTSEDVAAALVDEDADDRNSVIDAIAWFVLETLSASFDNYIESMDC